MLKTVLFKAVQFIISTQLLSKIFLFQVIQFSQIVLIQTFQFSMNIDFV